MEKRAPGLRSGVALCIRTKPVKLRHEALEQVAALLSKSLADLVEQLLVGQRIRELAGAADLDVMDLHQLGDDLNLETI
jgi:hypothetical protein